MNVSFINVGVVIKETVENGLIKGHVVTQINTINSGMHLYDAEMYFNVCVVI